MKPLDGLLVVALEQAVAAPYCTAELAAAGARVIKVERAEGDFARGYDTAAAGAASYFVWLNQGKESIALDIKDVDDLALLRRMIARADVFVQNLAPGAASRAGLAPEDLRRANPGLITCSITGYGTAPGVDGLKAYDLLVQAESGLSAVTGSPDEMGRIGVSVCDIGAGMTAHAGILEALIARGRDGAGRHLDISLFDVAANWMSVPLIHTEHGQGAPRREGLRHPSLAPYGAYRTQDDALTLISIQNEREWQNLARIALGRPDLAEDPGFASNTLRVANRPRLEEALATTIAAMDSDTFRARLKAARIAFGAVNPPEAVLTHPALTRRVLTTPEGRQISAPGNPLGRSATGPAPAVNAHGDALRREFAA